MSYYKKITVLYGAVILFLFLIATVVIVIPHLLNVTPYVVEDNKMAPDYRKGGLLFVQRADEQAAVGDPITYYENQSRRIKTSRVIAVDERIHGYSVKGDNVKQMEMGLVHFRNLLGKPIIYLPFVGFLVNTQLMHIVKVILFFMAIFLTFMTILYQKSYRIKNQQILHKQTK